MTIRYITNFLRLFLSVLTAKIDKKRKIFFTQKQSREKTKEIRNFVSKIVNFLDTKCFLVYY